MRKHPIRFTKTVENTQILKKPQSCENPLLDKISKFAYSHGIDHSIFVEKDESKASNSMASLIKQLEPGEKQRK